MILRIAFKNLLHKPLYAVLCWLLLACSTAVLLLLITLSRQAQEQLEKQIDGVDMVLGAKGSPLQLILSSVYNIDAPTGNISLEEAQRFMQHPLVESAIPISLGDAYMGYRIIGTTDAYLKKYNLQPATGKVFSQDMEVVIGATVAKRSQLKVGSKFAGTHGLGEKGHVHEEHNYVVTGVLPPTGLSVDQLILTSLQSVWTIHETNERQITSVLIKFKSPLAQLQMPRMVNENTNMQAAVPAIEINRLQSLMGSGTAVLRILGWLLAGLATCSIFVMLVQGTHERRYELALLRSMGWGRGKLLSLVLAEAGILGIAGILGGFLLSRLSGWFLQQEVFSHYHLNFSGAWKITPADLITAAAILAACLLAALFPAIRAFRLNISKTLANA
ncbi:FtsX-like permease family protein [Chitinophaga sp. SYP-B3965]|uniref:ABC transporter permease n=1 Tax=Chitinophaga sp. SYP-B3965 TaxID=2663120 RepID=UPI001299E3C1|nr:FtsX-like permease family protein [Chitinophaga sp. SYP-B3965]MRG46750.1 FtsX-like permease family protein [Chitinophaga sp. SYP-B3965]